MPDLSLERSTEGVVAGIDEAGRGPWAGPVVAAAVVLDPARLPPAVAARIDDSKKLAPEVRAMLCEALLGCAAVGVGTASVEEIDAVNILQATMLAMRRAVERLDAPIDLALVDGDRPPALPCSVRTVIGGDGLSLSVAAASIVAKVTRDRLMAELALQHRGYGWEHNAGYGTRQHRNALEMRGVTPHHRLSFEPISRYCKYYALQSQYIVDFIE